MDGWGILPPGDSYETLRDRRPAAAWRPCARVAGRAHDQIGHGHRRIDSASVWAWGVSHAFERSVLDPGPGLGDGHGLALFGHHHLGAGALKRGLNPRAAELGLYICGGR